MDYCDYFGTCEYEYPQTSISPARSSSKEKGSCPTIGNSTVSPEELKGLAVTVMGMGRSGLAATRLLQEVGACVTIIDEKDEADLAEDISHLNKQDIQIRVGTVSGKAVEAAELMVISPGIPWEHPYLEAARHRGGHIVGEIELASWFLEVPLIAVTGTNGKSTTVSLIGQMVKESGRRAFIGGNLGTPLCEAALTNYQSNQDPNGTGFPYDLIVAEVSSFQLETTERFKPWIAVMLNVTADHLDRYPSFGAYQGAKRRIFANQTAEDFALVNCDDPIVAAMAQSLTIPPVGFSLLASLDQGVYLEGNIIKARIDGRDIDVVNRDQVRLRGHHNLSNVLAAIGVGLLCQCPVEIIRRVASTFPGLEHALEFIRERHGVLYYDDSKGTNVDATVKALESFHEPILLILGGKDKGGDFTKLREPIRQRVKRVLLIGESASRIMPVISGSVPISHAESLSQAVEFAADEAVSGDVVLLSPACASFDMFNNYQDRGNQFKRLVNQLP